VPQPNQMPRLCGASFLNRIRARAAQILFMF